MIFLDFEASSLINGFPIEIGWAEVMPDRRIVTASYYIHCPRWMDQIERWDPAAEAVHRIPRRIIMECGRPIAEVTTSTNEALAGATVHIDSPFDRLWATLLFVEAGVGQRFFFDDVVAAFEGAEIDPMALRYGRRVIDRVQPRTHSAADDAKHWATLYRMSLREGAQPRL